MGKNRTISPYLREEKFFFPNRARGTGTESIATSRSCLHVGQKKSAAISRAFSRSRAVVFQHSPRLSLRRGLPAGLTAGDLSSPTTRASELPSELPRDGGGVGIREERRRAPRLWSPYDFTPASARTIVHMLHAIIINYF